MNLQTHDVVSVGNHKKQRRLVALGSRPVRLILTNLAVLG